MSSGAAFRARRLYFLLALGVLVLDQVTKLLAHELLRGRGAVEVVPDFFNLWYSRNPGGLFGYFRDWGDPWRSLLLTVFPMAAILLIGGFLIKSHEEDRKTLFGLGLILGGAAGNLIDRLFRGEVIDFLDVYAAPGRIADRLVGWFGTAHWPTFNFADSAIVIGTGLLLINVFRPQRQTSDDVAIGSRAADRRESL